MAVYEKLRTLTEQFHTEEAKFDGGNASAGKRARALLQEIRVIAGARRKEIQETKNAAKQAA